MSCLSTENLSFSYGSIQALSNINLEVEEKEIVGILGPNGAGKSTLLRCILRKNENHGKIKLFNKNIEEYTDTEISRLVSYVPQETSLPFSFTVRQVVNMGRYPHQPSFSPERDKNTERTAEAMKAARISELADRPFNHLSGGEKQRVLLSRSLAQDSYLMLLDEPTANLDIRHISLFTNLLKERNAEQNGAIVLVTHDLNLASNLAHRIVLMKEGRIIASGTPKEIMNPENIEQAYETRVRMIKDEDRRFFTYY